jgi:hypothetical protein
MGTNFRGTNADYVGDYRITHLNRLNAHGVAHVPRSEDFGPFGSPYYGGGFCPDLAAFPNDHPAAYGRYVNRSAPPQ